LRRARPHRVCDSFELRYLGRFDEDHAELERSIGLDPLSRFARSQVGWPDFFARRYAEAARKFQAAMAADPAAFQGRYGLGLALEQQHDYPGAIAELERAVRVSPDGESRASLAHAYAVGGRTREARGLLDSLETSTTLRYVSPALVATVHLALGDRGRALDLLEEGYRERATWMPFLKVDPRFDPLRGEPRFQALMKRMGFDA
jgi:tetratricopeptide repeat protein